MWQMRRAYIPLVRVHALNTSGCKSPRSAGCSTRFVPLNPGHSPDPGRYSRCWSKTWFHGKSALTALVPYSILNWSSREANFTCFPRIPCELIRFLALAVSRTKAEHGGSLHLDNIGTKRASRTAWPPYKKSLRSHNWSLIGLEPRVIADRAIPPLVLRLIIMRLPQSYVQENHAAIELTTNFA